MRRIVFTSRKVPNNSFIMRGLQMREALSVLGYNAVTMPAIEALKCEGDIIVWVRRALHAEAIRELSKKNIIVYDPLDKVLEVCSRGLYQYLHAVIFPSKAQCDFEEERLSNVNKYYLHHHWDPRLQQHAFDKFALGYWGYSTAADHTRNLIKREDRYTSTSTFPDERFFGRISCHYNVRTALKGLGWRPTTKISTAAACGTNIIVTRDQMGEELLPKDYPYWVDRPEDIHEVKAVIDRARKDFGGERWNYGLYCMLKAKEQTDIKVCAKAYGKILEDIDGKFNTCI